MAWENASNQLIKEFFMKSSILLAIASTMILASCASQKSITAEQNLKEIAATTESSESSVKLIGEEAEYGLPERLDNTNRNTSKNLIMTDSTSLKQSSTKSETKTKAKK